MRVASSPFKPGMETSMMIISGLTVSASLTPSCPFSASPQSSHSGKALRMPWTPRRMTAWSSTTITFGMGAPREFGGKGHPYQDFLVGKQEDEEDYRTPAGRSSGLDDL